jgi:hypothetical protein
MSFVARRRDRPSETVVVATEETLRGIKAQTDKLSFDAENRLLITKASSLIKEPVDVQDHYHESRTLFSGTVTANGNTSDIDVGPFIMAEVALNVTSVSGTSPTLSVYLEGKVGPLYKTIWAIENITAPSTHFLSITHLAFRYIRVRWVVGGTSPSFTFAVYFEGKS